MADYTPTLGDFTELKPFRFWCQKVLPLVYDDSLSYYELLCKVVDYLNKTMEDVDTMHDDVVNLHSAYVQLQTFVNDYFDNLDVQEEINNKLDAMAQDGSLSELISPFIPEIVADWLDEHLTPTTPTIDNTLSVTGAGADAKKTGNAIADQYSNSKKYKAGDYAIYNGTVYRCGSNIDTPEAWNENHWIATSLGHDVTVANENISALNNFVAKNVYPYMLNCYIDNTSGKTVAANGWARTPLLPIIPDTKCTLSFSGSYKLWNMGIYDRAGNKLAVDTNSNIKVIYLDNILAQYPTAKFFAFSIWDGASETALTESNVESWNCIFSGDQELVASYILNRYYDNRNGNLSSADGWAASYKYDLIPGKQIALTFSGNYRVWNLCLYNQNSEFIATKTNVPNTFITDDFIAEYPLAKYFAISVWDGAASTPLTDQDIASWQMVVTNAPSDKNIAKEVSENVWEIGTDKMKIRASLYGSGNGTFCYNSYNYNNDVFKDASDDITPVNVVDVGYIGANHGYNFVYKATLANHGLTAEDIGKTCVVEGETWVLVQVPNSSEFIVACKDDTTWYGVKTVSTPPTTFNFNGSITVTSMSDVQQLYPSVKNISVNVIENSSKNFIVSESYDIIDLKTGISRIISNVGNNNNNSIATRAGSIITVRNTYMFTPNGACVIAQNIKMNSTDPELNYYGGSQSSPFGSSDYFAVPMTTFESFSAAGTRQDFLRTNWTDSDTPPFVFIQVDNAISDATKMMIQGILMEGRNALIDTTAGFIHTTRKMYPFAVQPVDSSAIGYTYNLRSFRIPIKAFDMDNTVRFAGYCKVGKDYYVFCCNNASTNKTIAVPAELVGKNIETIVAKSASCFNSIVSYGIDFRCSGAGYLLLKLTD